MRKIIFIISIIAVVAIIGFYAYLEFRVAEIVFVSDRTETWADGRVMILRRLYNSGVDIDAYFEEIEQKLITANFTEDDIYAAALASGTPEFYPAFQFITHNPDALENIFAFSASIRQERAPNQTEFNFIIANLYLEIETDGPVISDVELRAENPAEKIPGTPLLSADGRTLAIDLTNVSGYNLTITGTGSVTFKYSYDVASSSIFSSTALEEQLLIVHANLSRNAEGDFTVEYINEPFSSLEDYLF